MSQSINATESVEHRGGGGGGGGRVPRSGSASDSDVQLSKFLSKILRHKAAEFKLTIGADGYVRVSDILALTFCAKSKYTESDVLRIVDSNDKKRCEVTTKMKNDDSSTAGELYIRAVQGHSIATVDDTLLLVPIISPDEIPVCIHGTYLRSVDIILSSGLKRMSRNHIHMAVGVGEGVTSGIRKSVEVLIYINAKVSMDLGIQFFRSKNNVILTSGLGEEGVIPPECCERIVDNKNGDVIWPNK
jgi:2'-phosphotransferase